MQKPGISWADYGNQIRSLCENGFNTIEDKIIDGFVKKVVSVESKGIEQYDKLINILIAFIDSSPLCYKYLKEINDKDNLNLN